MSTIEAPVQAETVQQFLDTLSVKPATPEENTRRLRAARGLVLELAHLPQAYNDHVFRVVVDLLTLPAKYSTSERRVGDELAGLQRMSHDSISPQSMEYAAEKLFGLRYAPRQQLLDFFRGAAGQVGKRLDGTRFVTTLEHNALVSVLPAQYELALNVLGKGWSSDGFTFDDNAYAWLKNALNAPMFPNEYYGQRDDRYKAIFDQIVLPLVGQSNERIMSQDFAQFLADFLKRQIADASNGSDSGEAAYDLLDKISQVEPHLLLERESRLDYCVWAGKAIGGFGWPARIVAEMSAGKIEFSEEAFDAMKDALDLNADSSRRNMGNRGQDKYGNWILKNRPALASIFYGTGEDSDAALIEGREGSLLVVHSPASRSSGYGVRIVSVSEVVSDFHYAIEARLDSHQDYNKRETKTSILEARALLRQVVESGHPWAERAAAALQGIQETLNTLDAKKIATLVGEDTLRELNLELPVEEPPAVVLTAEPVAERPRRGLGELLDWISRIRVTVSVAPRTPTPT